MSSKDPARWTATVYRAVVVLVGVALGARVAWWLLAPLVPLLVSVVVLGAIYALIFGKFRW